MSHGKVIEGLLGFCVGDSLGLPVDHKQREELKDHPVRDMEGYGAYFQPPGTWSEDSALTFCSAESLCRGLDTGDMGRRYCRWFFEGYWSAHGVVFQVDPETRQAILRIHQGVNPGEAVIPRKDGSGNGSLMRILPLAFVLKDVPVEDRFPIIHQIVALTHSHPRSHIACAIYVEFARNLLMGFTPQVAYQKMREVILFYYTSRHYRDELPHFRRILREDISSFHESMIRSDSYVVHTLEASLWCFFHCPSYVETVLTAVNLGYDTDTTAAVAGGLAGIHHGLEAIPEEWVEAVARKDDILALGRRLESCLVLD